MSRKLDFSFVRPVGLCLDQAPSISSSLFVGRAAQLRQMHEALQPEDGSKEQRRLVLGGMGGIGKTQLAIAYAKTKNGDYDSIFWFNATSEVTLKSSCKSIAEHIFHAQDLQNIKDEQIIAGIKQWLLDMKNVKWLLIFDNYDEPESYKLEKYYPQTSHGAIIITSRLPDQVGTEVLKVPIFDDIEDGLEILQKRSQRENVKHDIYAQRLAGRLAGLPLALATAGAFLHKDKSTWSFEEYLNEYNRRWNVDPQGRLRLLEYQDRTLYTTWNISYQRLHKEDPATAQILKLLAYFGPQDVWYELFRSGRHDGLPGWLLAIIDDSSVFESSMRILIDYCFIEMQTHSKAYEMHTCVHDWTLVGLNIHIERWSYRYALSCVVNSIPIIRGGFSGLYFARYVPHAIRLAHSRFDDIAGQMNNETDWINHISRLLFDHSQLKEAEQMLLRALAGKAAVVGTEHPDTLQTVSNLGMVYQEQGKLVEAEQMFLRALAGYEAALGAEHTYTLLMINNLSIICRQRGKLDEAEQMLLRVLAGHEAALGAEHIYALDTITNQGVLYYEQRKLAKAEQMLLRALAGYEAALGAEHTYTLQICGNLAILYQKQGKPVEAEEMLLRALAGYKKVHGAQFVKTYLPALQAMWELGDVWSKDRPVSSRNMYEKALAGYTSVLGASDKMCVFIRRRLEQLAITQQSSEDHSNDNCFMPIALSYVTIQSSIGH